MTERRTKTPIRHSRLARLCTVLLTTFGLPSGLPVHAQDVLKPRHLAFKAAQGDDPFAAIEAACVKENGSYARAIEITAALRLSTEQRRLLDTYLATVCTMPTPLQIKLEPGDAETRLNALAGHLDSEAQRLRSQARQFRAFVDSLSIAQQVVWQASYSDLPPF